MDVGRIAALRVLLIHNRYRSLGGEERAVSDLATLLAGRGDTVELLERASAEVTNARAARAMLGGGIDPDEVAAAVRRSGAEIVHAHNVHPLFGWRALAAAREAGARTVLHLHNFRLFCAIGVAYRDGAPCHRCHGRDTLPGLRLRCRGSLGESAVYAVALNRQQQRLFEYTDRFVVLSEAHGAKLKELGLPAERTSTLPNFVPADQFAVRSRAAEGRYALVAGRLVEEKGYDTAVLAARRAGLPLVIAGEGPEEPRLRQLAGGAEVRFTGRLSPEALAEVRRDAAVVLVPSRCEEACPYSVLEALASGVPVLAGDRGGLPELVGASAALPTDDVDAWVGALKALWESPERRRELGELALAGARARFGESRYYQRLSDVYGRLRAGPSPPS